MIDLVKNYSITSRRLKASAIRELLKLTERKEIISFAGGLPSPDSFPLEAIQEISQKVLKERGTAALQYGTTEGVTELREELVKLMAEDGIEVGMENILVTTSSQQGLDLVGRIFIDPTDPILVELPSYLGGLQAFSVYGASFIGVRCDDQGMIMADLASRLKALRYSEEHYKFIYTVPDFQNPSGITWSAQRRQQLIELANKFHVLVIDDSPYRELRYEGERPPSLHSLDRQNTVVTLRTFSKIFAPGFRLGWVVGHKNVISKLAVAKQPVDLCASPFAQYIAAEFLKQGLLGPHIEKIKKMYRVRRDAMLQSLERHMPQEAGVRWTHPAGGLFLWVTCPECVDTDDMFHDAVKENVAYVVGSAFHCDGSGRNTMRLNFSYPTPEKIDEGIARLAKVIKARLVSRKALSPAKAR
ncbi:MAG: PLP-dependent aminotransferase family protein [Elusimicrobiota bacterium]